MAFAGRGDRVVQVTCQREQQGDRVVGDLGGVDARRIAGEHAEFRRRVEVDGIDADAQAADHLELRTGFHDRARSQRHHAHLGAVGIAHQRDEVLRAPHGTFDDFEPRGLEEVDAVVGTCRQCDFHSAFPSASAFARTGADSAVLAGPAPAAASMAAAARLFSWILLMMAAPARIHVSRFSMTNLLDSR